MLRRRKQAKHLWKTTSVNRRKRRLMNNKKKLFARHRAFVEHIA